MFVCLFFVDVLFFQLVLSLRYDLTGYIGKAALTITHDGSLVRAIRAIIPVHALFRFLKYVGLVSVKNSVETGPKPKPIK